jgi:hypothetical protein
VVRRLKSVVKHDAGDTGHAEDPVFAGRKPISEVLQDIYDDKVQ